MKRLCLSQYPFYIYRCSVVYRTQQTDLWGCTLHKGGLNCLSCLMPASYDFLKSNHASTLQKKKQQNIKLSTSHKTCFKMHKLFLQSYFNLWL